MNIKKILEKKLINSDSKDLWFDSIDSAQQIVNANFLSDKDLELIILNSNTINSFNNLISLIYLESKRPNLTVKSFDKIVQYSQGLSYDGRAKKATIVEYPISSWIDSIEIVSNWLKENSLRAEFEHIVDYIACSTDEINLTSHESDLTSLVSGFLKDYGFNNSFEL